MFTGIVQQTALVHDIVDSSTLRRLTIAIDWPDAKLGESIAVNGACLTIAARAAGESLTFEAVAETLSKTNLGRLTIGDEVHLERALKLGDRLDGHFVLGHVDGVATIVEHRVTGDDWRVTFRTGRDLAKYLAPKGSVTLDGISLTVADLRDHEFDIALIPVTRQFTTLSRKPPGWPCNFEADILTKSVVNFLERRQAITENFVVSTAHRPLPTAHST